MVGVLGGDRGKLFRRGAVVLHVGAGGAGIDVHEHRSFLARAASGSAGTLRLRALLQRFHDPGEHFDVDGTAERGKALALVLVVELLHTEGENDVVGAGGNHGASLVQGRGGTGAGVFDIDHRDASDADAAQDDLAADALLAGDQTGGGVADEGCLQIVRLDAGVAHGRLHGFGAQSLQARVQVFAKLGHADPADHSFSAHGVLLPENDSSNFTPMDIRWRVFGHAATPWTKPFLRAGRVPSIQGPS